MYNGARICRGPQNTQRQRLREHLCERFIAASTTCSKPRTGSPKDWERIHTRSPLPDDMAKVIEALSGDTAEIEWQVMSGAPHQRQPDVSGAPSDNKPLVLGGHRAS